MTTKTLIVIESDPPPGGCAPMQPDTEAALIAKLTAALEMGRPVVVMPPGRKLRLVEVPVAVEAAPLQVQQRKRA